MKIKIKKSIIFFFDTVENVNFTRSYFGRITMKDAKNRFEETEHPVNPVKVIYIKPVTLTYDVNDDELGNFLDTNAHIVEE